MYYSDERVEIPFVKGKITKKKIKNMTYVYYMLNRVYLPEKKYTKTTRTTIGKVCDDDPDMMYPNEKYYYYFPEAEMPEEDENRERCECLKVGSYFVLRKLISECHLDEKLSEIVGDDADLFLDLALYTIVEENNAFEYYSDYAYYHFFYTEDIGIFSDSIVLQFINNIDEYQSEEFLDRWNENVPRKDKIYISYDPTNRNSQERDIDLEEYGNTEEEENIPFMNYAIAYDCENKVPLFYAEEPGGTVDFTQLNTVCTAKEYGYENIGFILDRGYFSQANIRNMDENGYDFVIMAEGVKSFVRDLVLNVNEKFEENCEKNICGYDISGITVKKKLFPSDKKDRYFHIYYSDNKKTIEGGYFEEKINEMSDYLKKRNGIEGYELPEFLCQYFEPVYHKEGEVSYFMYARPKNDVINEIINLCGYFVIITSEEMTAEEALNLYMGRDVSEMLFICDKSFVEEDLCIYKPEIEKNKMFIEFVALIIRSRLYTILREKTKETNRNENDMTVPEVISELENIEVIRQRDGTYRMCHALTMKQKDILALFDLTERDIRKQVLELNKRLPFYKK